MLIDTIPLPVESLQDEYKGYLNLYQDTLSTLWTNQWKFEGIREYSCYHYLIAQYTAMFNLAGYIASDIKYGNHDWSSLETLYSIATNTQKLDCNEINIEDIYTIFGIEKLHYNYVKLDKKSINIRLWVSAGTVVLNPIITSDPTHVWIDWGEVITTGAAVNYTYINSGFYNIRIYGNLSSISAFAIVGNVGCKVYECFLDTTCVGLTAVDLTVNNLTQESVDDIICTMEYIASTNNLTTGTLDVSGGNNAEPSDPLSPVTYCECSLKNNALWTVTTNASTVFDCSTI